MKHHFAEILIFILFTIIIAGLLMAWHSIKPVTVGKVVPVTQTININPQLYPDPKLTPSIVATSDYKELTALNTCGTYSQCHRLTTSSMKSIVCKEYPNNCTGTQEIDHFLPIALGGADDVKNLWAQPEHVLVNGEDLGFHTKDKLETYMVSQMKAGKITPNDAQQCILTDWVACYHKYLGKGTFGSTNMGVDLEDEVFSATGKG